MWPTTAIEIEKYEWTIDVYDLEVGEVEALETLFSDDARKIEDLRSVLYKVIASWNCKDRQGNDIPVSLEGLEKLPGPVLSDLFGKVMELMNQEPIPKAPTTSESSDTTQQ